MVTDLLLVVVGIGLLYVGGNLLVSAASRLAISFSVPVLLVGLTVVAWATSAPELIVSVSAAVQGAADIAMGNVVGSNIANIGLILSLTALVYPVRIQPDLARRDLPVMIGAAVLTFVLGLDGLISRVDGGVLFAAFVVYNIYIVQEARRQASLEADIEKEVTVMVRRPLEVVKLVVGLGMLALGAQLTVTGASSTARALGVSELIIGLTLVAAGTSLPELAGSLVAAMRRSSDIAVGNVVGSNITNVLAILGLTALIQPVGVDPALTQEQMPVMLAFSFVLWALTWSGIITRLVGGLLLAGYVLFVVVAFVG